MSDNQILEISGEPLCCVDRKELNKVFSAFCSFVRPKDNIEVSLVFCTPDEMLKINRIYRGVDKSTDVLSFPSENLKLNFSVNTYSAVYLGEILIDTNYIANQTDTSELGKDIIRVFIHGLLHLAGYDHLSSNQKLNMQEMESKIISYYEQDGTSDR